MKKPVSIFIFVLLLLFVGIIYKTISSSGLRINLNQAAVVKEVKGLNRLETAQFTIEKIIDAQENENNIFQKILYGNRILLIAHGEVIAGFDLSTIKESDIIVSGSNLTINIHKPQILVSKLDNDKTRVYDRQRGLLASDTNLESQVRAAAEKNIVEAACSDGILDVSTAKAKDQLQKLFSGLGFTQVTVQTESATCAF